MFVFDYSIKLEQENFDRTLKVFMKIESNFLEKLKDEEPLVKSDSVLHILKGQKDVVD